MYVSKLTVVCQQPTRQQVAFTRQQVAKR